MAGKRDRSAELRSLLETALDSTDEYLYEGEMCTYARRYSDDAASALDMMLRVTPPDDTEMQVIIEALTTPDRIERGSASVLLRRLRPHQDMILKALHEHPEPDRRALAATLAKEISPK